LEEGLQGGLILFGEWCHARHTVPYDALPDWFLSFDIFEIPTGKFWTVDRRNDWLNPRGIIPVPEVARGRFSQRQLLRAPADLLLLGFFQTSARDGKLPAELVKHGPDKALAPGLREHRQGGRLCSARPQCAGCEQRKTPAPAS
jgi:hypothetical protein